MNPETTRVPESAIGSLLGCLIEGDPQQQRRARNIRRRAIFFSIVLQSVTVAALIVFPLLGRGERLSTFIAAPLPPFRFGTNPHNRPAGQPVDHHSTQICLFCKTSPNSGIPSTPRSNIIDEDPIDDTSLPTDPRGTPDGVLNGLKPTTRTPARPTNDQPLTGPHRIVVTHLDPSHITHRVEPTYPPLCVQLRHETRVELEAIISTDGSIQSLKVISGDPLFYQSALDAVRQWRYTPAILNGRAVEVDTQITVIYTLTR